MIDNKPPVMLVMLTSSDSPADKQRPSTMPVIQDCVTKPLSTALVK